MPEAADAVNQGVCDARGADSAMKLGVNYPRGPLEWADRAGLPLICTVRFGAPLAAEQGEDKAGFLQRARDAVQALAP